ncbi:MAG TPA: amino acid adenylation domain-containing protein, partial [Pseudonocardiaceae bacterium]|nr:amino acid adenylation domain-containing protein [Pseudonocardiaceae bacterium]
TLRGNVLTATYDQELFDASRIRAMLAHLARILAGAAARPNAHLSELPLLDADDIATATAHAHGTPLSYPDSTIHRLVAAQTARTPNAPAVRGGDRVLTYAELDQAASRIAGHLHAQGVGKGALVAVLLDRDVDLISTLVGILRTGAGYVPLDSRNPPARLAAILDAARARLVVTTERFRPSLPADLPTVCLDRDRSAIAAARPAPDTPDDPDSLCHVVFTSGSTGTPKGVAASHRNVVSFTMGLLDILGAEEFRRTLFTTPLSFDACLVELWTPLCTGGTLVVADNLLVADAGDLDDITLANAVPSVLTEFLRVGRFPDTMRTLTIGAEPLSPALVDQVFRHCAVERIHNIYGPTETTAYITAKRLDRGDVGRITIGTPIPNSSAFVLDRYGRQAPVGVPGELLLGGPGVALGYLHRPDLTTQVFGGTEGKRTYRTGDLVTRRPDGELDYLRRLDNQVKVRGFRIELGEIESCLARHAAVRAAAAAVRTDPSGEPRLVGYVAATEEVVAELTAACQRDLPAYMVPDAIVVLPTIPLTATGKADRRGLPDPAWSRPIEPTGTVIRELAALWSALLGVDTPAGDFFALGGDSLTAVRMIDECNRRFGVALPALTAFTAPTLTALSDEIERSVLVASVEQEQCWLADRLADQDTRHLHHVAAAIHIADPPSTLTFRHGTLRSTFHPSDNGIRPILTADVTIPLIAEPMPADQLTQAMAAELRRPFDLAVGPPIRARLWRTGDTHVLMLTAHRVACDARSLDLLLAGGTDPTDVDYPDFAAHQRNQLDAGALDDDIAYWRDRLDGATALELGVDRPRPAVPSLAARRVTAAIDPDTITRLRKADPNVQPVLLAGVH